MNKYKLSITIEATLSFSIAIFVLFLVLGPLFILETSSNIILKIDNYSKSMSYYKMFEKNIVENKELLDLTKFSKNEKFKNIFEFLLSNNEDENINEVYDSIKNLTNYAIIISNLTSKNDNNNAYNNIDLIIPKNIEIYDKSTGLINYDILVSFKLPFNLFNVQNILQNFVSNRRAFIGIDGDRYNKNDSLITDDEIYISNNFKKSKKYHDNINCTRLVKQVEEVLYKNLNQHKNYDNQSYIKCNYCFKNINENNNTKTYITEYGKRFHSYENCPLMTAYISIVSKKYIEEYDLSLCQICANKKND